MLEASGFDVKLVQVNDNNDIDREVFCFKPDAVIIEALWVVPEKFHILRRFHPRVKWIVRIHSELPFLAHEGMAIDWISRYLREGVFVGCNSGEGYAQISTLSESLKVEHGRVLYLPNYYPLPSEAVMISRVGHELNVGCFGAIRPLKNQLIQAMAAISYADQAKRKLTFYINGSRVEGGGEPILKNIRALFHHSRHELIEVGWLPRHEFLELLRKIDVSMCVSFSETFCIVAADSVASGAALVTSPAVHWAVRENKADPMQLQSIVETIGEALGRQYLGFGNHNQLRKFSEMSRRKWVATL
jgi:hypothetical protein